MSAVNVRFSVREIEVLHRMLSQGMTVADMVTECDERIASDRQPDASDAAQERRAVLNIISIVRSASHPQALPRLDGKNAAR